jgi:hypothetical protein
VPAVRRQGERGNDNDTEAIMSSIHITQNPMLVIISKLGLTPAHHDTVSIHLDKLRARVGPAHLSVNLSKGKLMDLEESERLKGHLKMMIELQQQLQELVKEPDDLRRVVVYDKGKLRFK